MRAAIILLILALLFSATWWRDPPPPPVDLRLGYTSIETLDGPMMQAHDDIQIGYALYEGLLTFDPETFRTVPGVAESHTASDDRLTHTFHLRHDAKWSDGTPLTAEDFLFSWRLSMLPDTAPPYQSFLYAIRGARAYGQWATQTLRDVSAISDPTERQKSARQRAASFEIQFEKQVGIRAPDPHTLVIELETPLPYFEEMAACWPMFPLPKHILAPRMRIDAATGMMRRDPQWTKPKSIDPTMITNGPYRLAAWRFKREIRLEANPHWHRAKEVDVRSIRLINFKDYNTMFLSYTSGGLDLALGVTPLKFADKLIAANRRGDRNDVHPRNAFGTYYYVFNTRPMLPDGQKNPFADPRVRRAFAMSIDRDALVNQVTRLKQQTADTLIPPKSIPGYPTSKGIPHDPERARALLAEAGFPGGVGFPEIAILYNTGGGHENVAQAIAKMWERELGVRLGPPEGQEWKVFLKRRGAGEFAIARSGWFGDYLDPTTFLELFRTGYTNNDGAFSDADYDRMLLEAEAEHDPKKRMALLNQTEQYAMNTHAPIAPLYYYNIIHLFDPDRIQGVSDHPRDMQFFHHMKVKKP